MRLRSLLLVSIGAALSINASCPPRPCPPNCIPPTPTPTISPTPTPTPTPTPIPTPGWTLKIIGESFQPALLGAEGCCNTPPMDAAKGWTLAAPNEINAYASIKANMALFRTGPYSDQNYGWSLLLSPTGDSRLRAGCKYANSKGLGCDVDLVDHWALKKQNSSYNLYHDTCDITHSAPPIRYQRWVREVVHQTGDLQNVIYNLGNEGWLCNPTPAWYDGLVHVVRQAEADFKLPYHYIGNTWDMHHIGDPLYDYAEVHGDINEQFIPPPVGKPIFLTESANNNPPETPNAWIDYINKAKPTNGRFNIMIWRGGMDDNNWANLFGRLGGVPPVTSPRNDSACVWNSEGFTSRSSTLSMSQYQQQQRAAGVEKTIQVAPWLFRNNGNNLICDGVAEDDYYRRDFYSILQAMLAPACSIAGNPEAASRNPFDEVDNIEIWPNADPCNQSAITAGVHEIIFGPPGNHCQVIRGVNANGFKGSTQWSTNPRNPCTGPTPTPTPIPTPTPTPTPTPSTCPIVKEDIDFYRNIIKSSTSNQQMDLTYVACGPKVVSKLNNCGTACCELSAEKGNGACYAVPGMPLWFVQTGNARLVQVYPDNTFTQKVAEGSGVVQMCGPNDSRSCNVVTVKSTPPVCTMSGVQGCAH